MVLFDLGGVLIELGGVAAMRELTGIESDDELWRRWLGCRWVRSYERGRVLARRVRGGCGRRLGPDRRARGLSRRLRRVADRPVPRRGRARGEGARDGARRVPEQHQRVALRRPLLALADLRRVRLPLRVLRARAAQAGPRGVRPRRRARRRARPSASCSSTTTSSTSTARPTRASRRLASAASPKPSRPSSPPASSR